MQRSSLDNDMRILGVSSSELVLNYLFHMKTQLMSRSFSPCQRCVQTMNSWDKGCEIVIYLTPGDARLTGTIQLRSVILSGYFRCIVILDHW
jgi:hypothetical protein